jgi:hypothetical protein
MKMNYLFPYKYKKIAWVLLVLSIIGALSITIGTEEPEFLDVKTGTHINVFGIEKPTYENIANEIVGVLLIISLILVAFTKEKEEDEYISKIRLESLVWATYVNFGLLVLAFIFIYGFAFFDVMLFNMFTLLIFFVIRFNIFKYKLKKQLSYEE